MKVQLSTLQVLSQVIQTHTIYFSLVFEDTFFFNYSEESWEHKHKLLLTRVSGHTFYIFILGIPGTHEQKWQV